MAWHVAVENRIMELQEQLAEAHASHPGAPEAAAVQRFINEARRSVESQRAKGWVSRVKNWWSGCDVEKAWPMLHRAGEALMLLESQERLQARIPDLSEAVDANLAKTDRSKKYLELLEYWWAGCAPAEGGRPRESPVDRKRSRTPINAEILREIRYQTDDASDGAHQAVRAFRNARIVLTLLVAMGLAAFGLVYAFDPGFVSVCVLRCPGPSPGDVFVLELAGALGGLLTAVAALARVRTAGPPYVLPRVMRMVVGAATGIAGILVLQIGVLGSPIPKDGSHMLIDAVLFGVAQDPLMRSIEKKAGDIFSVAGDMTDPIRYEMREVPEAQAG
jgi:hypothetical protein